MHAWQFLDLLKTFFLKKNNYYYFSDYGVRWLDKKLIHIKQELAYDWLTFVANFGGTLGLFLGFSFFMIWDWVASVLEHFKK